jgi:hypothetical protein
MTIRPRLFWMLLASLFSAGVSAICVSAVVQAASAGDASAWQLIVLLAIAAVGVAFAILAPTTYINAQGSTIATGTWLTRRRYDCSQIVRIRASHSPANNLTYFLRADGSAVFMTSGYVWGEQKLRALADYLGVPLDW